MFEVPRYNLEQLIANLHNFTFIKADLDEDTWAAAPTCVAAVCTAKITQLANKDSFKSDVASANLIIAHNAIQKLLHNLIESRDDVKESAAVALDQLIRPDIHERISLIDNEDSLSTLKAKLKHPKEGMRFTIASVLHSYYTSSKRARDRVLHFRYGKLTTQLIKLTPKFEKLSYINKHLLHLRDLATLPTGVLIKANLDILKQHGVEEMLDEVKATVAKRVVSDPSKIGQLGAIKFISEAIATFRSELTEVRQERNSI